MAWIDQHCACWCPGAKWYQVICRNRLNVNRYDWKMPTDYCLPVAYNIRRKSQLKIHIFINSMPADALRLDGTRLYADTVLTLIGVFQQCLLMAVKCSQKITFEDMWPKFINTVPADALGLNGTRLYADTVLTLTDVYEQCLLMAVKCSQKITFEDMWPTFINTVPADALGLNGTRLYADTVLTLTDVSEQCLLMAVKCSQKITFEDMWPKCTNTVPADALGPKGTRL